ncbi:ATP-binding protein [uncultured Sulfitobacter sp.]|uniref:ATP-binding protein n=1 Tax=uncultured Sulfitobacter sp. TaxID=191468 RepID=UPI00262FE456|nr:ATP-binding protein [uncultured Sulfitobacter sp.]
MPKQLAAVEPMVAALRSQVVPIVSDGTRFRFELCVIEALTNLVIHPAETSGPVIEIRMDLNDGYVKIEIFDPKGAPPFDPCRAAKSLSEIDGMLEGGRGIGLIMECSDTAQYGPSGDRNRLKLEFWDADDAANAQSENGAET